jgi:hypothetical protein
VIDHQEALLPQLRRHADISDEQRSLIRAEWRDRYSTTAYVHRLLEAAAVSA